MITVILLGEDESNFLNFLTDKLKSDFTVYSMANNSISKVGRGPDILILETSEILGTPEGNTFIIVKDKCNCEIPNNDSTVIINSKNKQILKKLINKKNHVITCGMTSKDTISCTSITDDIAVTALQRSIFNIYDEEIQPKELRINISDKDDLYHILAYAGLSTKIDYYE